MYPPFTMAWKYLRYWIFAYNGKGHGIHSPFVYDLVTQVLNDAGNYYCYEPLEAFRQQLYTNKQSLQIQDLGAGSRKGTTRQRTIASIAKTALKPTKYAQLMFRLVNFSGAENILELGTSLGLTTAYMACACSKGRVTTLEGVPAIARAAEHHFSQIGLENIRLVEGNFDHTLPFLLATSGHTWDMVYIDGNHRYEPTIRYFQQLLPHLHNQSMVIFDDIHWSAEMEAAWKYVCSHEAVTLSIDLFFIGIVFLRKENLEKEHFTIRF